MYASLIDERLVCIFGRIVRHANRAKRASFRSSDQRYNFTLITLLTTTTTTTTTITLLLLLLLLLDYLISLSQSILIFCSINAYDVSVSSSVTNFKESFCFADPHGARRPSSVEQSPDDSRFPLDAIRE